MCSCQPPHATASTRVSALDSAPPGRSTRMDLNAVEPDVVSLRRDRPVPLSACLRALERQSFERFGLIVADDGRRTAAEVLVPRAARDSLGARFVRNETTLGAAASRADEHDLTPAVVAVGVARRFTATGNTQGGRTDG
jgi:hypothetical protein